MDLFHRYAVIDQFGNGKNIVGAEDADIVQQFFYAHIVEFVMIDVVCAGFQGADAFEQGFFQSRADAHDLTGGFHLSAQHISSRSELVKGETGEFGNHIVQLRLKCGSGVGNLNLVQSHANSDFGGDFCNGIAGCLGCQSRRPGNSGIDLDQIVLRGMGIQSELYIAAALDFKLTDQLDGRIVEHFQIMVI